MATTISNNPFPLGKILPGGTTASIAVTNNYTDLSTLICDWIQVRAHPANSGFIYLCTTAAAPDTTAFGNVLDVMGGGGSIVITSSSMNSIPLSSLFIGASDATSYAIIMAHVR
jgi:hypothetical protein